MSTFLWALITDGPASQPLSEETGEAYAEAAQEEEEEDPWDFCSFSEMIVTFALVVALDCFWVYGVGQVHGASAPLCGNAVESFWFIFSMTTVCQFCWPVLTYVTIDKKAHDVKARKMLDYLVFWFAVIMVIAAAAARMATPGPGAGYDEYRCAQYAKLSGAAYCPVEDLTAWDCGENCFNGVSSQHICNGKTTKALIAKWSGLCVVAFEGTKEYSAMVTDISYWKKSVKWDNCHNCQIHDGFLSEWESFEPCVQETLTTIGCPVGSTVGVTGHSLGAAVASLAMIGLSHDGWKIGESFTFGEPRVGDAKFADFFSRAFAGRFYRITHHMDPVPHVPPQNLLVDWHFQHVEPEVFYNGNVTQGYKICTWDGDPACSARYPNLLSDAFHLDDHGSYMDTYIGSKGCKKGG